VRGARRADAREGGVSVQCIACRHWSVNLGSEGYSEVTPAACGDAECDKGHWYIDTTCSAEELLRHNLLARRECPDFEKWPEFEGLLDPK
jgi:hypothetical protein